MEVLSRQELDEVLRELEIMYEDVFLNDEAKGK